MATGSLPIPFLDVKIDELPLLPSGTADGLSNLTFRHSLSG
jgi:hypothetical protein